MSKELFSFDPLTGMRVYFDYDESNDTTVLQYEQDVEPLLEMNKALANDDGYWKQGVKDEFAHYAQIPNAVIMQWLIEDGIDVYKEEDWPAVARKLNDPEFRYLKVTSKKHV